MSDLLTISKMLLYYYDAFRDSTPKGPTELEDIAAAKAAIAAAEEAGWPTVTISIKDGTAHLVSPAGAKVTVLDYDVAEVDDAVLETDDEGDQFQRIEVWS